jgi:N-acetylmuramic acid 6-phosphate etherase
MPTQSLRSTEARHPASAGLQDLSADEIGARVLAAQRAALDAVDAAVPAIAAVAEAGAAALRSGHRMVYVGAGSSGLMALADALELPGTFGIPAHRVPVLFAGGTAALLSMQGAVEDDVPAALADLAALNIGPGDVVICLAASGGTPTTLAVAQAAREAGATVAGFANVAGAPLLSVAHLPVLLDTGAEIVTGSTRMGAGSAQKAALNLMSVLVGTALGHVHDGYMVNLVADNAKLRDRAARIVGAVAGVDPAAARAALDASGGRVKPAILVARGLAPAEADAVLAAAGGHLARAMT